MSYKLSMDDAIAIRKAYAQAPEEKPGSKKYEEMKRLGDLYQVHPRTIENVVDHRSHKPVPSRLATINPPTVNHVR